MVLQCCYCATCLARCSALFCSACMLCCAALACNTCSALLRLLLLVRLVLLVFVFCADDCLTMHTCMHAHMPGATPCLPWLGDCCVMHTLHLDHAAAPLCMPHTHARAETFTVNLPLDYGEKEAGEKEAGECDLELQVCDASNNHIIIGQCTVPGASLLGPPCIFSCLSMLHAACSIPSLPCLVGLDMSHAR